MGTIVLSPQDCLSSPHSRQNSHLSSARSEFGRRRIQAVMVPSPVAQDCARHSHSGGLPPGDGLLPSPPLIHGQARVLSSRSVRSKQSSTSTLPPPPQRTFQESSPPRLMPKLSRSASAILPTPLVGSPPLAEGLLKGRLPFKVVQGNGPGNSNDHMQANAPKKLTSQGHGVHRKTTITSSHSSNIKANTNFEKSKQDGAISRRQCKETNVRMRRCLERSTSGKGAYEKGEITADVPAVTILRRPNTEEAAVELFAKFFQNSTQEDAGLSREEMDVTSENSENLLAMVNEREPENRLAVEEFSESELSDENSCKTVSTFFSKSLTESTKDAKVYPLGDAGDTTTPLDIRAHLDGDHLHTSKAPVLVPGCEELAPWERWAGPSYINSPPPSALPLPRFSKKQLKVATLDNACAEQMEDVTPDLFSTPPSSVSPLFSSLARQQHLNINSDAVAIATKDLKRILNLDLCRM